MVTTKHIEEDKRRETQLIDYIRSKDHFLHLILGKTKQENDQLKLSQIQRESKMRTAKLNLLNQVKF